MIWCIPLVLGFLLDLLIGDPPFLPHPVRLIGKGISGGECVCRRCFPKSEKGQMAAGTMLTFVIVLLSLGIPLGILALAWAVHPWLAVAVETIMCYQILATKALRVESMKVFDQLKQENLAVARKAVSMIVGRDTENLDEGQVAKAAVETVAENTSDGVIAPMLFMAVGGAPLGFLYKGINTLDSMIGYKNDRYLYFGRFAAKLDDVANFIPARISAVFMIAAAFFLKLDYKNGARIFKRDRLNHASPNSAQTEAVCAGALGIQLAGDAYYFGKRYEKKTIGDPSRPVEYGDIAGACRLLYGTALLCLIFCLIAKTSACLFMGEGIWFN